MARMEKKQNYMTVPAAIKELDKIEMLKGADGEYILDYAVTATQKAILNAFGMTGDNIHKQAREISSDLMVACFCFLSDFYLPVAGYPVIK